MQRSPVMVDTALLFYAAKIPASRKPLPPEDEARIADMQRGSREALAELDDIRISAMSYLEFTRNLSEPERRRIAPMLGKLDPMPVDARVSDRAAELLRAHRRSPDVCPRCLVSTHSRSCTACGLRRVGADRIQDFIILATADVTPDVLVLLTFDRGMIEIGRSLSNVRVESPQPRVQPSLPNVDLDPPVKASP